MLAIGLHFILRWTNLPTVGSVASANIPLIVVIILDGITLAFQIVLKLFRSNFGADYLLIFSYSMI